MLSAEYGAAALKRRRSRAPAKDATATADARALLEERCWVDADEALPVVDLAKDVFEWLIGIDQGSPLDSVVICKLLVAPLKVVNLRKKVGIK